MNGQIDPILIECWDVLNVLVIEPEALRQLGNHRHVRP